MENSYKMITNGEKVLTLHSAGRVMLTAFSRNKCFELELMPDVSTHDLHESSNKVQCNKLDSPVLWHKRLCHLNSNYMYKMLNENMIDLILL